MVTDTARVLPWAWQSRTLVAAGCCPKRTSGNLSPETPEPTRSVWAFNRKEKGPNPDPSFLPATSHSPPSPPRPALPFQFLEIPRSSTASCREPQNPENWNSLPETCCRRCRIGAAHASGTAHVPNAGSPVSRYTSFPPPSTTQLRHNTGRGKFPKPRENAPTVAYAFAPKSRGAQAGQVFV